MRSESSEGSSPGSLIDQFQDAQHQVREYLEILDVLPDIIYKIDPEGHFTYLSKSVTVLGYSPDELLGKHFSVIIHPEDLPSVSRKAMLPRFKGKSTGAGRAPKLFDERRAGERLTRNLVVRLLPKGAMPGGVSAVHGEVCATGQYREVGTAAAPEFEGSVGTIRQREPLPEKKEPIYGELATFGKYDHGEAGSGKTFAGTVGVIRDISERRRLEREKVELEQQLFHSRKMQAIGELAGGIAHDFNNLLGVISANAELIMHKFAATDPQLPKYTKTILSAVGLAADLTGKLLAFARKGKYQNVPLDLHALVIDTIQLLQHSIDRKISIRYELNAERCFIEGDLNQLKSALINIALNARDAMPEGGEMVFTTANRFLADGDAALIHKGLRAGDYVEVSILDTGIGMDEEVRRRLFEPFFTTKGMGKGTGLGLACVYGIVETHQGLIDVESKKGSGTTFRVCFPTIRDIPQTKSIALERVSPLTRSEGRILFIDDDAMFLDVQTEVLRENGYTVTPFQAGHGAIAYYREHAREIDLVIIDMIMPLLNGRECFQALKKINPKLSAIFSTGYNLENEGELLVQEGVVGFLQKPFDTEKLLGLVEKALHVA